MDLTRHILLTGATGLVGQFLIRELLRNGYSLVLLVRNSRRQTAEDRIDEILCRFEKIDHRLYPRPVVLAGELSRPDLGLSKDQQDWIAHHCRTTIHSAASISFKQVGGDESVEPYVTNLTGTRHFADFCLSAGLEEFHFISTAYVCGRTQGAFPEQPAQGIEFSNDYERSKHLAEELLRKKGFSSLTIYRPSIVMNPLPDSSDTENKTIHQAFALFKQLGDKFGIPEDGKWFQRLGFSGKERKNIVPADWVCRVLVNILGRPQYHQQIYHLTHQLGTTIDELQQGFVGAMVQSGQVNFVDASKSLAAVDALARPFVEAYSPYFKDDATFDQRNLENALRNQPVSLCPDVGQAEITRMALKQSTIGANREATSERSLWRCFLSSQRVPVVSEWKPSGQNLGLSIVLTGAQGGTWTARRLSNQDWSIEHFESLSPVGRIYTSAKHWDEICSSTTSLEQELQRGSALIEQNEQGSIRAEVEALVSWLRNKVAPLAGPRMEASHDFA